MIKFNKYNVTNTETKEKSRVFYTVDGRVDGREAVTIYAKDYGSELGAIFSSEYENDTDSMTDYFETGKVVLFADHPLYQPALERASA